MTADGVLESAYRRQVAVCGEGDREKRGRFHHLIFFRVHPRSAGRGYQPSTRMLTGRVPPPQPGT